MRDLWCFMQVYCDLGGAHEVELYAELTVIVK